MPISTPLCWHIVFLRLGQEVEMLALLREVIFNIDKVFYSTLGI